MVTDIVIRGVGDSEWVLHRVDRWKESYLEDEVCR